MKTKTIPIPIYCAELTVVYDKDLSYIEKEYKTKSLKDFGAVTLIDKSKYRHYVVGFEYSSGSIVAHEIVHIIKYLYKDCGIKLDNDEHQAYLTGWLFDEIYNFLNKK